MGLLPDMQTRRLLMRRECRECFARQRLQSKPLVSDPGMSESLSRGGGENVPGTPGT